MAITIASREVEKKAIHASRILGVNKTMAVEIALDYYLQHYHIEQENSVSKQDAARLLDELVALPVLDDHDPDEILGYNENGSL